MMTVDVNNGTLDITLTGWDRVWAVKKHISVPVSHIKNVEIRSGTAKPVPSRNWKTLRLGGSYWPGKIIAGTYWSWETKEWSFWNTRKGEKVVVIDLEGNKYSRLVLEVDDPEGLVEMVKLAAE
jgi:hypothetical protein